MRSSCKLPEMRSLISVVSISFFIFNCFLSHGESVVYVGVGNTSHVINTIYAFIIIIIIIYVFWNNGGRVGPVKSSSN